MADLRSEVDDDDELARAVATDHRTAPISARQRAMLEFAWKLTRTPAEMTREDVDALRAHGLDDRAVTDVTQVAAYFNYINRIADALGVDPEDFMPAREPRTGSS
ncbi:MAG: peroxidase-related enzyme [Planctomycetota bacterium JB042]